MPHALTVNVPFVNFGMIQVISILIWRQTTIGHMIQTHNVDVLKVMVLCAERSLTVQNFHVKYNDSQGVSQPFGETISSWTC